MRKEKSKPLLLKPFERTGGYGDNSPKFLRIVLDAYYAEEADKILEEFSNQEIAYSLDTKKRMRDALKGRLKLAYARSKKLSLRGLIRRWLGIKTKEEQIYEDWLSSILKRFRMKQQYGMVEAARCKRNKANVLDEGGK